MGACRTRGGARTGLCRQGLLPVRTQLGAHCRNEEGHVPAMPLGMLQLWGDVNNGVGQLGVGHRRRAWVEEDGQRVLKCALLTACGGAMQNYSSSADCTW